jgi:hypothetical protein
MNWILVLEQSCPTSACIYASNLLRRLRRLDFCFLHLGCIYVPFCRYRGSRVSSQSLFGLASEDTLSLHSAWAGEHLFFYQKRIPTESRCPRKLPGGLVSCIRWTL